MCFSVCVLPWCSEFGCRQADTVTLFLSLALSNSQDWNTKFVHKSDVGAVLGSAIFKGSPSFRGDKMFQIKTKNLNKSKD